MTDLYKIAKLRQSYKLETGDVRRKSVSDELALMRTLLQLLLERSEAELLQSMPKVEETIMRISTLVQSCHKMDVLTGETLDKNQLSEIADRVKDMFVRVAPEKSNELLAGFAEVVASILESKPAPAPNTEKQTQDLLAEMKALDDEASESASS